MEHLVLVAVVQRFQQLRAQTDDGRLRQRPAALDALGQVLALHQTHDQKRPTVFFEEVGHVDDAGVIQPGQSRRLAAKLLPQLG